jgi:hypothetical protein
MPLRFRSVPGKRSKMTICRCGSEATRHNQNCVMVQVGERDDIVLPIPRFEVLNESMWIGLNR